MIFSEIEAEELPGVEHPVDKTVTEPKNSITDTTFFLIESTFPFLFPRVLFLRRSEISVAIGNSEFYRMTLKALREP